MKKLLYIPIIALLLSCNGARQVTLTPQEQEVHNVINALMAKQHYIDKRTLVLDELQPIEKHELTDKYGNMYEGVTVQQIQELLGNAKATCTFQLQTANIKGHYRWYPSVEYKQMFSSGSGWEPLYEKYKERSYTTITNPVFTSDGTIAVVSIHTTNDWRMGSGGTYLLKKVNGKWHCIRKIGGWIS